MPWSEVWEAVGKGLTLGLLGTVVGWWLKSRLEHSIQFEYSVRLEQYRQSAALATEVARERVRVLAQIWSELAKFEAMCMRQKLEMGRRYWDALVAQGAVQDTPSLPTGLFPMYEALESVAGVELDLAQTKRFFDAMEPTNAALLETGREVHELIGRNRFWLGAESQRALRKYCNDLSAAFTKLTPLGTDRETFRSAILSLKSSQGEAEKLLPQLQVIASAV